MSAHSLGPAVAKFVAFFGELGPRWGLEADACRVHALLYVCGRPTTEAEIGEALDLRNDAVKAALAYLTQWHTVMSVGSSGWTAGSDPWEMLLAGLEERRRRELAPALATLRECRSAARSADGIVGERIGRVLSLVQDLAAIDVQARRLSPQTMRRMIGISGAAARLLNRTFGRGEGER